MLARELPDASCGELSRQRARLESNAAMSAFLLGATDFESRWCPSARRLSVHARGTIFEALIEVAVRASAQRGAQAMRAYVRWQTPPLQPRRSPRPGRRCVCTLCDVTCTSENDLRAHKGGKRHKTRARVLQEVELPQQTPQPQTRSKPCVSCVCALCDLTCTSEGDLRAHKGGKRHKSRANNCRVKRPLCPGEFQRRVVIKRRKLPAAVAQMCGVCPKAEPLTTARTAKPAKQRQQPLVTWQANNHAQAIMSSTVALLSMSLDDIASHRKSAAGGGGFAKAAPSA